VIELLSAIAIVVLLASLLIPTVQRMSSTAKSTKCLANERQIGMAIQAAAQDLGGIYPPSQTQAPNPEDSKSWQYTLVPYFGGSLGILVCPARAYAPSNKNLYFASSYSLNPRIMVDLQNETPRTVYLTGVPRPTEVILVADGALRPDGGAQGRFYQVDTANQSNPAPSKANQLIDDGPDVDGTTACFRFRHDGRLNVVFADLHAGSFGKHSICYRNLHIAY